MLWGPAGGKLAVAEQEALGSGEGTSPGPWRWRGTGARACGRFNPPGAGAQGLAQALRGAARAPPPSGAGRCALVTAAAAGPPSHPSKSKH